MGDEHVHQLSDEELQQRLLSAAEEELEGRLVRCENADELRDLLSRLQRQHT